MADMRRFRLRRNEFELINAPKVWYRDFYHLMLWLPWWVDLICIVSLYGMANVVFAFAYYLSDGIYGAHGYGDLFFFSVQTLGTIGYGAMYPVSTAAHWIVTVEAFVGIFMVAMLTGLLFAKFSVPRARVQFAERAAISPMNGQPTLVFRVGNERTSQLMEATLKVVLVRTERTTEGQRMYRMYDLKLVRDRSPALSRSWTVMHTIDETSPLSGATPESLERDEIEFILSLSGVDETSVQTLHSRHRYESGHVLWGARHADMLSDLPEGRMLVDMAQFHKVIATPPTDTFPYPREATSPPPAHAGTGVPAATLS